MSPTDAIHHPRIDVSDAGQVTADDRLGRDMIDALRADGDVESVEHAVMPLNFACPDMIAQEGSGAGATRVGATDVMSPWSAAVAQ